MKTFFKTLTWAATFIFTIAISSSCGNAIEDDTATVLIKYNEAISAYHENISFARTMYNDRLMVEANVYQALWNQKYEEHKLDSLLNWFYVKHGEKEYNKLKLKVDDNFDRKVNK